MTSVSARLAAGDRIHMQIVEGERQWWFEGPYQVVPDQTMQRLQRDGRVVEAGDCLFGTKLNSQTWAAPAD